MRILITGAGGTVGKTIAENLSNEGHTVIGTYRNSKPDCDMFKSIKLDLIHDKINLSEIDVLIHSAACLCGSVNEMVSNNVYATNRLLEASEYYGVKKIVYLSSVSVYGKVRGELNEWSDICNPDIYGMTKKIAEDMVMASAIEKRVILRLPRMLGRYVRLNNKYKSGFLSIVGNIVNNNDVICYNPEIYYNNYLNVNDLTKFLCRLLKNDSIREEVLVLGCMERIRFEEIIDILRTTVGSKSKVIKLQSEKEFPNISLISTEKASKFGFTSLGAKETLATFIEDFIVYSNFYKSDK